MKIYLAGAASRKYEDFCRVWRDFATNELEKAGFEVINPIKDAPIDKKYTTEEMFEIVEKDFQYVIGSDIILAEVGNLSYQYVGTSMEILFAYQNGIPVIAWSPLKDNFFLTYHSTRIYETIEDAIKYCITIKQYYEEETLE